MEVMNSKANDPTGTVAVQVGPVLTSDAGWEMLNHQTRGLKLSYFGGLLSYPT